MNDPGYFRVREHTTAQVHLVETRTRAGYRFGATCEQLPSLRHRHLCFLTTGVIEERRGSRAITRTAPSLRLSPAEDDHQVRCGCTDATCSYIRLENDDIDRIKFANGAVVSGDPRLLGLAARLIHAVDAPYAGVELDIECLATELFAGLVGAASGRLDDAPPWLWCARDLIEEMRSSPMTLTAIAAAVGVHRVHLARAFRRHFGCTPGDYLRQTRVRRARELLIGTAFSTGRVAAEAGFYDHSHLDREFRRAFGVTPKVFRAQPGPHKRSPVS